MSSLPNSGTPSSILSLEEHWQNLLTAATVDSPLYAFVEKTRRRALTSYEREVQPLDSEGSPPTKDEVLEQVWRHEFLMRRSYFMEALEEGPSDQERTELMQGVHMLDDFYHADIACRKGQAPVSDVINTGDRYFEGEESRPAIAAWLLRHHFAEIPDNLFELLEQARMPVTLGDLPEAQQATADEEVASTHYEAPITLTHVQRSFERFGMLFEYVVARETLPKWEPVLDPQSDDKASMDWKLTSGEVTTEHVVRAEIRRADKPDWAPCKPIRVYTTPEGPIMGIKVASANGYIEVRHPAMIQYTGGRLQLKRIFGIDRVLLLRESAVTVEAPPSEILLSAYPGYVMACLMGRYNQTLSKPLHEQEKPLGYTWLGTP